MMKSVRRRSRFLFAPVNAQPWEEYLTDTMNYIPLSAASKLIPGRPAISTLHRWCTRGVRGVKLANIRIGSRRFTTQDAIDEFVAAQIELDQQQTHYEAEDELRAEGL